MDNQMDDVRINSPSLLNPLRILLIMTVVIAAYDTGRAVLSFIELVRQPSMDVLLVILWLLTAPLTFTAAVALFYAQKRLQEGERVNMPITIGFAAMVLSSVSSLLSQASILNGNGLSIMILCGLVLVCYIILFLYYQRIGVKALAVFASVMGVLCGGYYLVQGVVLVAHEPQQILGYLFTSYLTALMIALSALFFVLTVGFGPVIEEVEK